MSKPKHAVESMRGFDSLSDHDKVELVKFEHYLRVKREPEQPIEGAYAHVYGEVVYEADWPCMKVAGALCRHGECKP